MRRVSCSKGAQHLPPGTWTPDDSQRNIKRTHGHGHTHDRIDRAKEESPHLASAATCPHVHKHRHGANQKHFWCAGCQLLCIMLNLLSSTTAFGASDSAWHHLLLSGSGNPHPSRRLCRPAKRDGLLNLISGYTSDSRLLLLGGATFLSMPSSAGPSAQDERPQQRLNLD